MSSTGFHWGKRIAVVYTLFAVSTLAFVAFAFTERVDLVREDYYQQSLRYDTTAIATANAAALGSAAGVRIREDGHIVVRIPDGNRSEGTITFYRPSSPEMDSVIPLKTNDDGEQVIATNRFESGKWTVIVQWTFEGRQYRQERSITLWSSQ